MRARSSCPWGRSATRVRPRFRTAGRKRGRGPASPWLLPPGPNGARPTRTTSDGGLSTLLLTSSKRTRRMTQDGARLEPASYRFALGRLATAVVVHKEGDPGAGPAAGAAVQAAAAAAAPGRAAADSGPQPPREPPPPQGWGAAGAEASAPWPGQNTDEALAEWGFDAAEITKLRDVNDRALTLGQLIRQSTSADAPRRASSVSASGATSVTCPSLRPGRAAPCRSRTGARRAPTAPPCVRASCRCSSPSPRHFEPRSNRVASRGSRGGGSRTGSSPRLRSSSARCCARGAISLASNAPSTSNSSTHPTPT